MKIIFECEKLAVLQEGDMFIIHILNNYRMVKEINTNRNNLLIVLNDEFHLFDVRKIKKINKKFSSINNLNEILKLI